MQSVAEKNLGSVTNRNTSTRGLHRASRRRRARRLLALAAAGALSGLLPHHAHAATPDLFTGAPGDWNTTGNWSTGVIPTSSYIAIIDNGNSANLATSGNASQILVGVSGNYSGYGNVGGIGNLTLNSGAVLTGNGGLIVGEGGSGSVNSSGNITINTGASLLIAGGSINLGLDGNTSSTATVGTVNVAGGNLTYSGSNTIYIGAQTSGQYAAGTLNITSGNVSTGAAEVDVGDFGTGILNVTGGNFTNTGTGLIVDNGASSTASTVAILNVSGTGNVTVTQLSVSGPSAGAGSTAFLNQSGGNVTVTSVFKIARSPNANASGAVTGVYNLTSGALNLPNNPVNMSTSGNATSIFNIGGNGAVNLSGTSSFILGIAAGNETVNQTGNSTVTIGSLSTSGLFFGIVGSIAKYNLAGGTLTTPEITQNGATSTFNFNGGTVVANGNATESANFMANLTNATINSGGGTINTNGLSVTIAQPLVAPTGNGTIGVSTIPAGGIGTGYDGSPLVVFTGGGGNGAAAVATLNSSGNITGVTITNPGTGYTSNPTISFVGNLGPGGTAAGNLTGTAGPNVTTGGLTVTGGGTLTLTSMSNSFAGNITINGATTLIANNGVNPSNGNTVLGSQAAAGRTITINSGATLSLIVNNVFGNAEPGSGGATNLPSIIVNGGNLSGTRYDVLGNITLSGGTVTNTNTTDSGTYQDFQFLGSVTVNGSSPSTIANGGTIDATHNGDHLGSNTVFNVSSTGGSGADLTVSAPLRDQSADFNNAAGALTKIGNGTMALTGASTYSGGTTISAGAVRANNSSGSATGIGNITVAASTASVGNSTTWYTGGILGGNGSVSGTVTLAGSNVAKLGGVIAAGGSSTSYGNLSTGNQNWYGGCAYEWKIGTAGTAQTLGNVTTLSSIPGASTNDSLLVSPTLTSGTLLTLNTSSSITGNAAFTIAPMGNITVTTGKTYNWEIAQIGNSTSTQISVQTGASPITYSANTTVALVAGGAWSNTAAFALDTSGLTLGTNTNSQFLSSSNFSLYFETVGSTNDLVLSYNAAPEPGTAMLCLMGAAPMLAARRRRRRR